MKLSDNKLTQNNHHTKFIKRGWTEAMQLMKEGGKWELYIPSELGYGDRGAGGAIPGGAVLVFTLELLKVSLFTITFCITPGIYQYT